jgi:hypothetical protein
MDQTETSRIATEAAMRDFIATLSAKRQARVSIVCGAIVEAGDPSGSLNRQFREDQCHALAVRIALKRAGR